MMSASSSVEGGVKPTVLVVDDEPFNVEILEQELEDIGYASISACNGREALALMRDGGIDIVLLDIMMPEMDGFAVLQELKAEGRLVELPVIVVSAIDDVINIARCVEIGAEDFLTKPFDPVLLRARLSSALEKKHLRDQVARQLKSIRTLFGKYVPTQIAESIVESRGTLMPTQETATVLYCDIEGFTQTVETMTPGAVLEMMNAYFEAVLAPVGKYGGTVNQFLGDAMLVTFNLPVADPDHYDKAVQTAIEICEICNVQKFCGMQLKTRMGIHSGEVVVGNIDAGDRLNYTIFGDTVNVAARLEAHNKQLGSQMLISGSTVAKLENDYQLEDVGDVVLRGKNSPVSAYCRWAN